MEQVSPGSPAGTLVGSGVTFWWTVSIRDRLTLAKWMPVLKRLFVFQTRLRSYVSGFGGMMGGQFPRVDG